MKSALNIFAICLFVLGMIIIPITHRAELAKDGQDKCCANGCGHGKENHQKHNNDHCPVCQLSIMPFNVATTLVAPETLSNIIAERLRLPLLLSTTIPSHLTPFSCGPPA
jgi:hypothetical protein